MTRRGATQPGFLRALADGRSGRRHFWSLCAYIAVPAVLLALATLLGPPLSFRDSFLGFALVWLLIFTIPLTAAMACRFHDIGRRGRWALPQFGIAAAAFLFATVYAAVIDLPYLPSCSTPFSTSGYRHSLQADIPAAETPPPDAAERRAGCDAELVAALRAYRKDRRVAQQSAAGLALLAYLPILLPLTRPSQTGPHRLGPAPFEVPA